jgi:hypothetical protein
MVKESPAGSHARSRQPRTAADCQILAPPLECGPGSGQRAVSALDQRCRVSKVRTHGDAPPSQSRVQAPRRPGVPCRRDVAWSSQTPRSLAQPDSDLGQQVRGRGVQRRRAGRRPAAGVRGAHRRARAAGRPASAGAGVSKSGWTRCRASRTPMSRPCCGRTRRSSSRARCI